MSIDNLTIGQLRDITTMLHGIRGEPQALPAHPMVGQYVILRCSAAGVHAGYLVSQNGDQAVLRKTRRLWSWTANDGVALSGLAFHGLKSGKIDTELDAIALTGVCETIPCTTTARESIQNAK
jgi:hypothetical protein